MRLVVVECQLGGYEQKLQTGNPDGIVLKAAKHIRLIGGNFLGAGLCEDFLRPLHFTHYSLITGMAGVAIYNRYLQIWAGGVQVGDNKGFTKS